MKTVFIIDHGDRSPEDAMELLRQHGYAVESSIPGTAISGLPDDRLTALARMQTAHDLTEFDSILSSPHPVLVARAADGTVLDSNEPFTDLTGYERAEILGQNILGPVFFLNPEFWVQAFRRLEVEGEVRDLETRILRKDGLVAFVIVSLRRVEIDDEPFHVITIRESVPLTSTKAAEQELLLSKFCIDNAGIGIFHTFEQQIFNANEYVCRSLGYSVEELRTMCISDIDPVITEEKMREISTSLEMTGSATHQTVHRRKDGTTFPVEITSSIVEFHGNQYTISFVKDISERALAEKALRESEEKFRVLSETSPAAIALYQGEDVIYINPTAARLIGYTAEELSRISFWGCVHDDFKEMVRQRGLERLLGEAVPSQYECKFVTKNGKELWALLSVGRIEYKGKPAGIVTLIDTTEAKLAEDKLRSSLAEKEILLKEVHHRVKNNLQIISSLLELQSDYILDEQSRVFFRDSQNRIRSMALIHEKLYQSESLAFIDLRDYVQDLADYLFSSSVKDPDLIRINVEVGEVSLSVDEAIPCGLIINELISNSLKHAFPDDRGGEITVKCRIREDGWISLTVSDNGIGLPPGLDVGNTETLGLQIVTMLVKQLHGRIELSGDQGTLWEIAFSAMDNGKSASA